MVKVKKTGRKKTTKKCVYSTKKLLWPLSPRQSLNGLIFAEQPQSPGQFKARYAGLQASPQCACRNIQRTCSKITSGSLTAVWPLSLSCVLGKSGYDLSVAAGRDTLDLYLEADTPLLGPGFGCDSRCWTRSSLQYCTGSCSRQMSGAIARR